MSNMLLESESETPITYVQFNQDFTSLCIGTQSGCMIVNTVTENVVKCFSLNAGPIVSISRLFFSSLITYVTKTDLRLLIVYHSKRNTKICDYRYSSPILSVKMNRDRLIVCVETTIYIHNIRDMHLIHRINETPPNYRGIIALSPSENCLLAFPGTSNNGTVYIFNALTFKNQISISAHDGLIAALEFNSTASLLATASEKGTVIRVFNVNQGTKFAEFRRGLVRNVQISSLSFSLDDLYLVSSSETETVHIFKLEKTSQEVIKHRVRSISTCSTSSVNDLADELASAQIDQAASPTSIQSTSLSGWSAGIFNAVGSILMTGASFLPYQVSDVFQKDRAFATCHIMGSSDGTSNCLNDPNVSSNQPLKPITKRVSAIVYFHSVPYLLTVGSDGLLHIFEIDSANGGEGTYVRTINLLSPNLKSSSLTLNVGLAGAVSDNQPSDSIQLPPGMGIITKQAQNFQNPLTTGGTPPKASMMPIQKSPISFAQAAAAKDSSFKDTKTSADLINDEISSAQFQSKKGRVNINDVSQFPPIN